MDRVLIFATLGFALLFLVIREGGRMTKVRIYEIIIAIYTFSCCFALMYLPVLKGDGEPCGTFGTALAIWPNMILIFLLVWIVAKEKQWRIQRPKLWLVLLFMGVLLPPGGEIHPSLLVGFGEVATFAGALMGVDYHYKFRIHELEEETRRLKNE